MDRYWGRRLRRHALLGSAATAAVAAGTALLASPDLVWRVSVTSGWVGALLLAATLLLGPLNVIRGRPNPVSFDLRRDVGIWSAILAGGHTLIGLFVHLRGHPLRYFIWDRPSAHAVPIRLDTFGAANWIGLGAAGVLVFLGVISNDAALRWLGTGRWKRIQRWVYAGAAAVALHGLMYQLAIEKRVPVFVLLLVVVIVGTGVVQLTGRGLVRRGRRVPES